MIYSAKDILEMNRNQKARHEFYQDAVKLYEDLECHFEGEPPRDLIRARRPGESESVWEYRKTIYESRTKPILSRVFNTLQKIRKSPDWVVKFATQLPPSIASNATPERYLNADMPLYTSITNWTFSYLLRYYLMDANAFVVIHPNQMGYVENESEYIKPMPIIYDADDIYDYVYDEKILVESDETVEMSGGREGAVFYAIDKEKIERWIEVGRKEGFALESEYYHNLGYLPAFQTYGIIIDSNMSCILAESRLQPMVPSLNEMAREYSDLQAEVVQHIHSTFWYYAAVDCTVCNGSGRVLSKTEDNMKLTCSSCGGGGKKKIALNSYEAIALPPPEPGSTTGIPTPPAGFIQKDIEMARLQNQRVDAHGYNALAALNMQFLDSSPLNQSGLAKEVDRDELQNTVHSIAEDLVRIADHVCRTIIDMRYSTVVPDAEVRRELYPVIPVPDKYDLLTASMQVDALAKLTTAGVDSTIIQAAQQELASKMFSTDATVKNRVMLNTELDPLAGKPAEEISVALMNGTIREVDAVIHDNKKAFIDRALETLPDFMSLTRMDKMAVMEEYANELISQRQTPPNARPAI